MNKIGKFLSLLALGAMFAGPVAFALNPDERPANYIAAHWDTEDGLPHNSVKQLYQTRDGYLWIGTQQGLARFDGINFTNFNRHNTPALTSNLITSMMETGDGSLWIGTGDGLVRFLDGTFNRYDKPDGLRSTVINALCVAPDGSLWIAGREGVTRWLDGKFVKDIDTSPHDTTGMRNMTVDRENAIWLTVGTGALRYKDGAFTFFGPAQGLPSLELQAISEDPAGRTIAVTQRGLLRLEDGRFEPLDGNQQLSSLRANRTLADRAGNLWVGSVAGLDRWHGGVVVPYVDTNGNGFGVVDAVIEDHEGALWVGTSGGLHRLTDRRAHSLSAEDGIPGSLVLTVKQTRDGSVWVSSWGSGVTRFQGGTSTHLAAGAPLSHETVSAIYEAPDGTIWLGNRGSSLDRLKDGKVTTYVLQSGVATSRPVTTMLKDDDGTLLLGIASRGLLQLLDDKIVPVPEASALTDVRTTVWCIYRATDGRILMGTSLGLFERRADRTWQPVALPNLKAPVNVRDLLEVDGTLWLATDGHGLVRYKSGRARAYGSGHGMVDDTLFSVLDDGHGSLWVTSARGLARIRKGEFAEMDRGSISSLSSVVFGRVDGLLSSSSSGNGSPSAIRLTDGRLMIATDKGVAVIDPASLPMNMRAPTVAIESVLADEQLLPSGREVTVAAGSSKLEIRYTALSLITPKRLRFRYRLEGSDTRWIEAGYDRSAYYTHLAPGRYTFHVLASNNDGVWNNTGATLAITISPYFYETLSFRIAAVLLSIGALAFLVGWRLRQLEKRQQALVRANAELDERVLERTAELEEAHKQLLVASRQAGMAEVATGVLHNVGNVLNSVNVSANLMSQVLSNSEVTSLERVAALLRDRSDDIDNLLHTDPKARLIPGIVIQLAGQLAKERAMLLAEQEHLSRNIDHIKGIVVMQQSIATVSGVLEKVRPADLLRDALEMHSLGFASHGIEVLHDCADLPPMVVDRHKVMQILVNLITNAERAIVEARSQGGRIKVSLQLAGDNRVRFSIADNGVGIPAENFTRIFSHGFTTRHDGHGFGLHSGALAAREMGGSLRVESAGAGLGATFTLELPFDPRTSGA